MPFFGSAHATTLIKGIGDKIKRNPHWQWIVRRSPQVICR
jgi:hypothetical protein